WSRPTGTLTANGRDVPARTMSMCSRMVRAPTAGSRNSPGTLTDPSPPALATAIAMATVENGPIPSCMIGWVMPTSRVSGVASGPASAPVADAESASTARSLMGGPVLLPVDEQLAHPPDQLVQRHA